MFEVLDEAGVADDVPNVDGMTGSGGRGPSVGVEIAVLQVIITRPKIMSHPSRVRVSRQPILNKTK